MTDKEKKLEDFGEHIAGAKKETYFRAIDPASEEAKTLPLSKLWTDKEIKAIKDIKIAAIAHTLRESLPNRPRSPHKLNRWLDGVSNSQKIVVSLLEKDDPVFTDFIMKGLENTRGGDKIYLLTQLDRENWKKVDKVSFQQDTSENNTVYLSVYIKGERHTFYPKEPVNIKNYNAKAIIDEFAGEIQAILKDKEIGTREMTASSFDIYTRIKDNTAFICAKTDRQKTPLIEFATLAEAREYKKDPENIAELSKRWTAHREHNSITKTDMRNAVNEERTGESYRDHDITPDEFMATFGVRGGQFGNWVTGDERQQMLNATYDGFMDLSKALKIDPKAIGLNGTLGIAFGARGSGWASAHYERGEQVINLTKTRGAGSLAHEWWHALDHYMKNGSDLLTRNLNSSSTARHQELIDPVSKLVKDIHKSELYSRSQTADAYRSQPYFATDVEMTARAFEGYIQNTLSTMGIKNDFLVNIRSEQNWQKNLDAYPYPKAEELEPLGKAYNAVFDTLKEVDKEFVPTEYEPEQVIHADTLAITEVGKTKENNQNIAQILKENATEALNSYAKDIDRFNTSIDNVVNGHYGRGYVPMGRTPDVLKILGVPDTKVRIKEQHLEKVMATYLGVPNDRYETPHNVTPKNLKQIPNEIHNPIAVFKSSTRDNSYLVLTEQYEQKVDTGKNSPIVAIFNVNAGKNEIDIINIGSIYGRSQNQLLRDFTDNLLYLNKEKGQKFLNTERLQLPWDFTSDTSNLSINYKTEQDLSQYILSKNFEKSQNDKQHSSSNHNQELSSEQPSQPHQSQQSEVQTTPKIDTTGITSPDDSQQHVPPNQPTIQNVSTQNTYINCPYAEKNQAKALGAKWDNANKSWYVPQGADLSKFEKWLPQEKKQSQQSSKLSTSPAQAPQEGANATSQPQRIYLYTRPSDNEKMQELKAQGIIKFDLSNKLWYAYSDNAETVKQWTTRPNVPTPEEALTDHLRSIGIKVDTGHPIFDEKPHRLSNDGSNDKNVMYHAYANQGGMPYARITNFSRNGVSEWTYPAEYLSDLRTIEAVDRAMGKSYSNPSTQSSTQQAPPQSQTQEQKDENKIALENLMAERAKMLMSFAPLAENNQNYLERKQVTANGVAHIVPSSDKIPEHLRSEIAIGNTPKQYFWLLANNPENKLILQRGSLVIPQYNSQGEMRAFETIAYNGKKYALKDAEKKSMMTVLGDLSNGKPILITEGYATGATLYEHTGRDVVIAFGKNGLMDIAQELREKYPDSKIYIGADNDHNKEQNYGLQNAFAVQESVKNVYVLIPQFKSGDTGKDWNDIFVDKGVSELKRQITEQLRAINPEAPKTEAPKTKQEQEDTPLQSPKEKLNNEVIKQKYPTMKDYNLTSIQAWKYEIIERYADDPIRMNDRLNRLIDKLPDLAKGEVLHPPKYQVEQSKTPEPDSTDINDGGRKW